MKSEKRHPQKSASISGKSRRNLIKVIRELKNWFIVGKGEYKRVYEIMQANAICSTVRENGDRNEIKECLGPRSDDCVVTSEVAQSRN